MAQKVLRIRRGILPPSSMAQWLLAPALAAILFSYWMGDRAATSFEQNHLTISRFGTKKALVATLQLGELRVAWAATGREVYRHQIPQKQRRAKVNPLDTSSNSSLDWLRWPGTATAAPYSDVERNTPEIEFVGKDEIVVVKHEGSEGKYFTFIHLQTGKQFEWAVESSDSIEIFFEMAGAYLVAMTTDYDPWSDRYDDRKEEATPFRRMAGRVCSLLAVDFATGSQAIDAFALDQCLLAPNERLVEENQNNGDHLPDDCCILRSFVYFDDEKRQFQFRFAENDRPDESWPCGKEKAIISHCTVGYPQSSRSIGYWLVDETRREVRRATWPFAEGAAFYESMHLENQPAVQGVLVELAPDGIQTKSKGVYWNLETGQTATVPDYPIFVRQYENLLMVDGSRQREVIDLAFGRRWSAGEFQWRPSEKRLWLIGVWLLAWIVLVRATCVGDYSQLVGVALALLSFAAMMFPSLHYRPEIYNTQWLIAEWIKLGVLLSALSGVLIGATLWRGASQALLATMWPVTIVLVASFLLEGEQPYQCQGVPALQIAPQPSTLRAATWTCATQPNNWNFANNAGTQQRHTAWEKVVNCFYPPLGREAVAVRPIGRDEED